MPLRKSKKKKLKKLDIKICSFCTAKELGHPTIFVRYNGMFRSICNNCLNGDTVETENILKDFD